MIYEMSHAVTLTFAEKQKSAALDTEHWKRKSFT